MIKYNKKLIFNLYIIQPSKFCKLLKKKIQQLLKDISIKTLTNIAAEYILSLF